MVSTGSEKVYNVACSVICLDIKHSVCDIKFKYALNRGTYAIFCLYHCVIS